MDIPFTALEEAVGGLLLNLLLFSELSLYSGKRREALLLLLSSLISSDGIYCVWSGGNTAGVGMPPRDGCTLSSFYCTFGFLSPNQYEGENG